MYIKNNLMSSFENGQIKTGRELIILNSTQHIFLIPLFRKP
jgi:hypothetical protein